MHKSILNMIVGSFMLTVISAFTGPQLLQEKIISVPKYQDTLPAETVIKLGDGKVINLTNTETRWLEGDYRVLIDGREKIIYFWPYLADDSTDSGHTLTTGKQQTYKVVLPDGSLVHLNEMTSLSFPPKFSGHERRVKLIGEAYFEVSNSPFQTFRIENPGQAVLANNAHFNINCYQDEHITKAFKGEVQIVRPKQTEIITLDAGFEFLLKNGISRIGCIDTLLDNGIMKWRK